ncbi:Glutamate--tRNA ligase 2 [Beijerinckiaceae bacterium RH AL1]|nr:glutamate--tRNA ligase [Beijerinckiaceae bacterium]VVB44857.1 Glutamate--tRNA ligase 2 [Beijerinckiaceae bacterium RH CH11]VVB44936.1 Glutamate--tRNA ligase 2 [Beijerinckiaceae bacterium RH AL8]VVC54572.1 Glutamate--tRNA ligase 2 [Beijerinckiaceae bacterium RH AL1]
MTEAPTVRFAPSPTGMIHIGNARTALFNALLARKAGGRFILRFDDTDVARSRAEYAEAIEADLAWLGVTPDLVVHQSARVALYAAAADRLRAMGRLYPCYETADELDRKRKRQQARGLPPVYDRAALELSAEDRARLEAEGRRPHWRFLLDRVEVTWDDLIRGESRIDCASLSDPVLVREDGSYLYTLPSVVDDIDLEISDVIRGEDHVTNTAVQIQLGQALGGTVPRFGHHNLLTTASGEGLSKRSGALSLGGLREAGIEPLAVAALAVLVGTSDAVQPVESLDALGALFDLAHVSRNPARFDVAELESLSARTLHALPFAAAAPRLQAAGIAPDEAFWLAVRGNITRFDEVAVWHAVVAGEIEPVREDPAFLAEAAALLPAEPWDAATWSAWTGALKAAAGRKGRALFHPLRLALTGRETGPELAALLPLMGRERALARLG